MKNPLKDLLKKIFGDKAAPVTIGKNEVLERLGVKDHRFTPTPLRHKDVMKYTDRNLLNFMGDFKGPCQTHYANPEDETMSAAISYTTETIIGNKRNFALTIHNNSKDLPKREQAMVFGLYGHYSEKGILTVDKIIAPAKDSRNCLGEALEIGVSEEILRKSLIFAELCAKDIYETGKINTRKCFDAADRAEVKQPAVAAAAPAQTL